MNSRMIRYIALSLALAFCWEFAPLMAQFANAQAEANSGNLRAPSIPLIACDPYFSVWSSAQCLTDVATTHWTGKRHRLTSLVSIDGKHYRLMGAAPADVPAMRQSGYAVTPTQSTYSFSDAGVDVSLKFTTPALPYDLDLLSRPVAYLTCEVRSHDGRLHQVKVYFEASAEITVDTPDQIATGTIESPDNLVALKMGSEDQAILEKSGDDRRIDWGYLYVAATSDTVSGYEIGDPAALRSRFVGGRLLSRSNAQKSAPAEKLAAGLTFDIAAVSEVPTVRWLVAAYDDVYSIEYMKRPMRPYWRRNGMDAHALLTQSARDYSVLLQRCDEFDSELMADLEQAGGRDYAQLAALAFRQCFAAGKFVADANDQPIQFCKENHSNGCIATSDVFYPMSPQFLLFGPSLSKSFIVPFMNYAASDRWKFPFAPHDLGTYPKANGQVYGGGEASERDQMPVEESGNLLILMAAIAKLEGHADFASQYWPQLQQWAEYLKEKGYDPENQLCTDDFAGHLGHNVNLSAKAICGLGAFAQLCELRGDHQLAVDYRQAAEEYAAKWIAEADDGDHFRLAFDKPGSWSQKYNLVWDRVLGLNLFPDAALRKEMDFYRRNQNLYGLPLDNRADYTKLDWILWTATLTQNQDDFRALTDPVCRFLTDTPDRAPLTDWYQTTTGRKVGFTARPVVGGVFMQLLQDDDIWSKWAKRDRTNAGGYARMPIPPRVTTSVAAADTSPATWHFTTEKPVGNWHLPEYDASSWRQGTSGFGTHHTPGAHVQTVWDGPEIWLRRTFDVPSEAIERLRFHIHHDEDAEVYINGILAQRRQGYTSAYEQIPIRPAALASVKPTGNVLAEYCRQTSGGQYIDIGIVTLDQSGN